MNYINLSVLSKNLTKVESQVVLDLVREEQVRLRRNDYLEPEDRRHRKITLDKVQGKLESWDLK